MKQSNVVVYISDHNFKSKEVLDLLDEYSVSYNKKNVSDNGKYMKELHEMGIYGTPAMFVKGHPVILGYQKNKIKYALGIDQKSSHYSSHFDGFDK